MKTETYDIEGMSCAACAAAIERVTRKMEGVQESNVNLVTKKLNIRYDEAKISPDDIIQKVEKAGFKASLPNEEKKPEAEKQGTEENRLRRQGRRVAAALVLSALMLYVSKLPMVISNAPMPSVIDMHSHPTNYALIQMLIALCVMALGKHFYINGFKALWHRQPNMDSLVAVGSGSAFLYSLVVSFLIPDDHHMAHQLYFESAAVIVALVMLGKHMEARSSLKTTGAINALMSLLPETAILIEGEGKTREVPVKTLKVGDLVLIQPGSRIPLDAVVVTGHSAVDESMLTGESIPVEKSEHDALIGGSMNQDGMLRARITKVGEDTTLASIVRFVQQAQEKKAPISKMADRISGVFVPIVIAVAFSAAAAWLIAGKDIGFALKIFVSVLIIACPCAMGLATPTAIVVGTGLGAQHGILIRNGEKLETAHKVDTVLFDKTGTITEGKPAVVAVYPLNGSEEELLQTVCAAEKGSQHPLAKAVVAEAEKRGIQNRTEVVALSNVPGQGVKAALADGRHVLVGNERMMLAEGIDLSALQSAVTASAEKGETQLFAAENGSLLGMLCLSDTIKQGVDGVIGQLQRMGIETVLVSGDRLEAARHVAAQAGIAAFEAGVLPEGKALLVEKYKAKGKTVMMVGDGINDAPALTVADVGCAIGSGTDIALASADMILMRDDLMDVVRAIRLCRYTITNIKQNLTWAFVYNTIGIPVACGLLYLLGGPLMNPMLGGLAMSLSSVSVVTNALSLRRKKL